MNSDIQSAGEKTFNVLFFKHLFAIRALKAASGRVCGCAVDSRGLDGWLECRRRPFFSLLPTEQTDGVVRRILCQAMVDEIADGRKLVKDLISCAL